MFLTQKKIKKQEDCYISQKNKYKMPAQHSTAHHIYRQYQANNIYSHIYGSISSKFKHIYQYYYNAVVVERTGSWQQPFLFSPTCLSSSSPHAEQPIVEHRFFGGTLSTTWAQALAASASHFQSIVVHSCSSAISGSSPSPLPTPETPPPLLAPPSSQTARCSTRTVHVLPPIIYYMVYHFQYQQCFGVV